MKRLALIAATVAALLTEAPASAQIKYVQSLGVLASDPVGTCTNLTHYYNSATNKVRCCENTAWVDCGSASISLADERVPYGCPSGVGLCSEAAFKYAPGTNTLTADNIAAPTSSGLRVNTTDAAGNIVFRVGGTTVAKDIAIFEASSGKVGFGNYTGTGPTTLTAPLGVTNPIATSNSMNPLFHMHASAGGSESGGWLTISNDATYPNGMFRLAAVNDGSYGGRGEFYTKPSDGNPTGAVTRRVVIDHNGALLVGGEISSAAGYRMQVTSTGGDGIASHVSSNTSDAPPVFAMVRSRGTFDSPTAILDGNNLGQLVPIGYTGSAYASNTSLQATATENWSPSALGQKWTFNVVENGTTTARNRLDIAQGVTVLNEDSRNVDLRVEGDTDVNLIFADASTDRVGIGMNTPLHKLDVTGDVNVSLGVQISTTTAKPTCDSSTRGLVWVTQGAGGVEDNADICLKDLSNAYAWRVVAQAPSFDSIMALPVAGSVGTTDGNYGGMKVPAGKTVTFRRATWAVRTAGNTGSTAYTYGISDGVGTCTFTGPACNATADVEEVTPTGTCTFGPGTKLTAGPISVSDCVVTPIIAGNIQFLGGLQ